MRDNKSGSNVAQDMNIYLGFILSHDITNKSINLLICSSQRS
jgi:hypothetical protein